jgi:hypothetical protein
MDLTYIYIGSAGIVFGLVLSLVFGIYNKSTASSFTSKYLGSSLTNIITNSTVFSIGFAITILAVSSAFVRDLSYPKGSPINFTIETLLMGTLCSSIIFAMTILRGYTIGHETMLEFSALFVKFGLLHILFQFSGVYSELFPYKKQ